MITICPHCHRLTTIDSLLPTTAGNKLTCGYCAQRWINRGGRPLRERNRERGDRYQGREDYRRYSRQWAARLREADRERQAFKGRWWNRLEIGG
jgi:hypothetical protein